MSRWNCRWNNRPKISCATGNNWDNTQSSWPIARGALDAHPSKSKCPFRVAAAWIALSIQFPFLLSERYPRKNRKTAWARVHRAGKIRRRSIRTGTRATSLMSHCCWYRAAVVRQRFVRVPRAESGQRIAIAGNATTAINVNRTPRLAICRRTIGYSIDWIENFANEPVLSQGIGRLKWSNADAAVMLCWIQTVTQQNCFEWLLMNLTVAVWLRFISGEPVIVPPPLQERIRVREFIEDLISSMLGGNLDDVCVGQIYENIECELTIYFKSRCCLHARRFFGSISNGVPLDGWALAYRLLSSIEFILDLKLFVRFHADLSKVLLKLEFALHQSFSGESFLRCMNVISIALISINFFQLHSSRELGFFSSPFFVLGLFHNQFLIIRCMLPAWYHHRRP